MDVGIQSNEAGNVKMVLLAIAVTQEDTPSNMSKPICVTKCFAATNVVVVVVGVGVAALSSSIFHGLPIRSARCRFYCQFQRLADQFGSAPLNLLPFLNYFGSAFSGPFETERLRYAL